MITAELEHGWIEEANLLAQELVIVHLECRIPEEQEVV